MEIVKSLAAGLPSWMGLPPLDGRRRTVAASREGIENRNQSLSGKPWRNWSDRGRRRGRGNQESITVEGKVVLVIYQNQSKAQPARKSARLSG